MSDHLLESSRWDDSNKWSNKGFCQEINILEKKLHLIWDPLRHVMTSLHLWTVDDNWWVFYVLLYILCMCTISLDGADEKVPSHTTCFWTLPWMTLNNSSPKEIYCLTQEVIEEIRQCGVCKVFFVEIVERGKFRDRKLTTGGYSIVLLYILCTMYVHNIPWWSRWKGSSHTTCFWTVPEMTWNNSFPKEI